MINLVKQKDMMGHIDNCLNASKLPARTEINPLPLTKSRIGRHPLSFGAAVHLVVIVGSNQSRRP